MRRINGKLLLALLLGLTVLSGTVFAVHQFQYQRIARALLWQARRAEEQGQMARMVKYLQRYLEFNPTDKAEKTALARAWAGEAFAGNFKARDQAVKLLDEVLTFDNDPDPELRRLLVKVALEIGSANHLKRGRDHLTHLLTWDDVEGLIKEENGLRAAGKELTERLTALDPDRGELESYWGQLLEAEGRKADAIGCYRLAVRHAPEHTPAYGRLAYMLRRLNENNAGKRATNATEADQAIDTLVTRNESSHMAYLTRWRYRRDFDLLAIRETGQKGPIALEAAAEDVAQALKRKPDSVDVLLVAADLERLRGRSALEEPDRPLAERLATMQKHRDQVQDYLKRGLELVKRQGGGPQTDHPRFQLLWHKANLLLDDLDRADAPELNKGDGAVVTLTPQAKEALTAEIQETIAQVRKSRVPAAGEYLQGRLLIYERRWAKAAELFENAQKLLAPQPDLAAQANLYLGQCYERLEEHKLMYEAYRRVADWDPTSVPAQMGMAMARWAQGRREDALNQYKLVMSHGKVPARGWVDIARLQMQLAKERGDKKRATWEVVEAAVAQAEKVLGATTPEVVLLKADLALSQDKPRKAAEAISVVLEVRRKDADLYSALMDLHLRQKENDKALETLRQAEANAGDVPAVRAARARYLAVTKEKEAGEEIRALAKRPAGYSDDDQARLLTGLADAAMRAGAVAEARQLWQELAELPRQSNDLRLRLLLFDLAIKAGDKPGLESALAGIKKAEAGSDGGPFYRYGEALRLLWLVRTGDKDVERDRALDKARMYLDQVLAAKPSWPPVFLARAEIAERKGNPDEAIRNLQKALDNGDKSSAVISRLVALLRSRNRNNEALALYDKHQRELQNNTEVTRAATVAALYCNEIEKALKLAELAVRNDSTDPDDLVFLGQVLALAKRDEEAEKKFDEAVRRGGSAPRPWVAKVDFLASRKDRRADALKAIEQAREKIAAPERPLALARCHELVGQLEQARKAYQEALAGKPNDAAVVCTVAQFHLSHGELKEAEALLRQVVSGKVKAPEQRVVQAKRGLAMVLASGADYQRFAEAMELVGLKLDAEGRLPREVVDEDTESRRAKARVLASQSQRQFRAEAIRLLEGLGRERPLTADDQFVLALLYSAEGKPQKAQAQLVELTKAPTRTPQYLAQYAVNLISRPRLPGNLTEAKKVLGWLKELEKSREVGPNGFGSVEMEARWLEASGESGDGEKALELLRTHAGRKGAKPEDQLLVLSSLGRQKRFADAFAMCEETWAKGKVAPEAVGGVSVALLRAMKPTDAQVATVERHLTAAVADRPASMALLLHLAELYNQRGRYEDAATTYRRVLEREPSNVVALNNLAWLLATREGDAREALEHINKVIAGLGRRSDLLDTRGQVYLALKEPAKALIDLKEAAEDHPTPSRQFHLALAHHQAKDRTNARRVLREATDNGLAPAQLHAVEQESCRKLLAEYGLHAAE